MVKKYECYRKCDEMHTFDRGCDLHVSILTRIKWKLARGAEAVAKSVGSALDDITDVWY